MPNSRPRASVGYLAYQPPFYAIYFMSGGCNVTAHHYRENCQFPPRGHLAGWYTIYQTCPPYMKPVRPYLNPQRAEVRAIWHINRTSVVHMIYQVLVTLRLTIYGENSPVSAAIRRWPFCRLICHITNLHTILKLLWWRHNHVTYSIYRTVGRSIASISDLGCIFILPWRFAPQ